MPALWRAQVLSVHDGDTLTLLIDRGLDDQTRMPIRLKDVRAPELGQLGGPETQVFTAAWASVHDDLSEWPFLLETFRTPRSDVDVRTFERWVGVVRDARGESLNDAVTAYVHESGYGAGA